MFHIFHDAVFPTSNLHTMHVLLVYPHIQNLHPVFTRKQKDEWIQNCFERKLYLKIILLGYLFNFYTLKTLPYTLLLYGKQGTTDFGELRHKSPILPCGLVAWAKTFIGQRALTTLIEIAVYQTKRGRYPMT